MIGIGIYIYNVVLAGKGITGFLRVTEDLNYRTTENGDYRVIE